MNVNINYKDNIFYLKNIIHTLEYSFKIQIDEELFLEKIIHEILFIQDTIVTLFHNLEQHTYMLNRNIYIRYLYQATLSTRTIITQILNHSYTTIDTYTETLHNAQHIIEKYIYKLITILKEQSSQLLQDETGTNTVEEFSILEKELELLLFKKEE